VWLVINSSSGTSITNNVNNNVLTTTGSNTINGETNLTFDGSTLIVSNSIAASKGESTEGLIVSVTGNSGSGLTKYGIVVNVTGGASENIGISTTMEGSVTNGYNLLNYNNGINNQYGVYNIFTNVSTNAKAGVFNSMQGTSTETYGFLNDIQATGDKYGLRNTITGTGGTQYGSASYLLENPGNLYAKYGHYVEMSGTGGSASYGFSANVTGSSSVANNYSIYTFRGTSFFNVNGDPNTDFRISSDTQPYAFFLDSSTDTLGIQQSSPTAKLHIGAGSTTANTAPLKFTGGNLMTTAEVGAMEFLNTALYFTDGSGKRFIIACIEHGNTTADTTFNNNAVYADIGGTQTQISLIGGRTYEIEAMIYVTATNGQGAKFKWNYTGTPTSVDVNTYTIQGNAILANGSTSGSAFATPNEVSLTTITAAQIYSKGILTTSTTGTLSIQGAQASAGATNTVFKRGSFIKVTAIP
jgi:hypothetical protein